MLKIKEITAIIFSFVLLKNAIAKDYVIESHGKRTLVKEHIYSKNDNLKIFKLEGTFTDNAGNFGEFNSIVNVKTLNNVIEKLEASNEFIYNANIKAYNIALRTNNELEQGVGKWYFSYASKSINAKCIGVSILTSLNEKESKEVYNQEIPKTVTSMFNLANETDIDGVVCSPHELKLARDLLQDKIKITPGIRLPGDKKGDQKRVMTPDQAFQKGASAIVMGRSLTNNGNIKKNLQKLIDHLSK